MDDDRWELLRPGNALIVATVLDGGRPFATRAWGLVTTADDPDVVRLVIDADEQDAFVPGGAVAVTGGDPVTLRSTQVKGTILDVAPAGPDDVAASSRHRRATFAAIHEADGSQHQILERLVPVRFATCGVRVEESFDQTPGPGAGAPVGATS